MPACVIQATGGFVQRMAGLDPAMRSTTRHANFWPTGRASHQALKTSRRRLRSCEPKNPIKAGQSRGQPWASMRLLGWPNGRSRPASQGPGRCRKCSKSSSVGSVAMSSNSSRSAWAPLLACQPSAATVMGFRRLGAELKSIPKTSLIDPPQWQDQADWPVLV